MFANLKLCNIFLACFFVCSISVRLQAQNKISENPKAVMPTTCEYIKNALDYSLIEAVKTEDSTIKFIFYSGRGENSKALNQSRMSFIKKYLDFRNPDFNQIVFAQGEKKTNLGKIEIYVRGELEWEIFLEKNKSGWSSCVE